MTDFQDRGDAARRAAGIDGTAGDAQDIPHAFVLDKPTGSCLLCGLSPGYRKHVTTASRQNPDGSWSPDVPLPLTDDFDIEVTGPSPYEWEAWVGMRCVASGTARTRLGLRIALIRAKRKHNATGRTDA